MQSNEDEHNKIHKFYHLIFALNPQYIVVVFRRKQLRVVRDMVWRIKKPFNINRIQRILISYHLWAFICLERTRHVVDQPLFDQAFEIQQLALTVVTRRFPSERDELILVSQEI